MTSLLSQSRCSSEILAGNLESRNISDSDECSSDDEEISNIDMTHLHLAETIIEDSIGTSCFIRKFVKLIIDKRIPSTDILVQAMCYRVQQSFDGTHSIRYQPSYGMFWAGVRNLLKSRGLIAFKEYIPIPTDLSKFTKLIYQSCGLDEETLGKSGVQNSSIRFWLNAKNREQKSKIIPVSLSVDGKKIVASPNGAEDLGGLGGGLSVSDEEVKRKKEEEELLNYVDSLDDRSACFKLYDLMTNESFKLVNKLTAIDKLLKLNTKRADKNGHLNRYIFVLNDQKVTGLRILKTIQSVQCEIIRRISVFRNCIELVGDDSPNIITLHDQENFIQLGTLHRRDNESFYDAVEKAIENTKDILSFSWDIVEKFPVALLKKGSILFTDLIKMCVVSDNELYIACGLGRQHPLSDMKELYSFCHSSPDTIRQREYEVHDESIFATITSQFGSMSFGKNMVLMEGGLYVTDSLGSSPQLVAIPDINNKRIEFSLKFFRVEANTFQMSEEYLVSGLASSYIVNAVRGCILVLYNQESCVVFNVEKNDGLINKMKSFIKYYLKLDKCINRRSPEMIQIIEELRKDIAANMSNVNILGSYPLVTAVLNTPRTQNESCILLPLPRPKRELKLKNKIDIRKDISHIMDGSRKFLIKQARELVVVNISDISGSLSSVPHTILGATYVSGSSLKTIVKDCLKATEAVLVDENAKVLNISVDGESLHLATTLPDGSPGTELQLAKNTLKIIEKISKNDLIDLVSRNERIELKEIGENHDEKCTEEDYLQDIPDEEILLHINESIAVDCIETKNLTVTIEDIERMLRSTKEPSGVRERREKCKNMPVKDLRNLCLKEIFPAVRTEWLTAAYGRPSIIVKLKNEHLKYSPRTVFEKCDNFFRTVTFDTAHIVNLLRESAAKGRLEELGLTIESLNKLTEQTEFSYLINILKLRNGSLMYDPMNQSSSYKLFSNSTEKGLTDIGDMAGAKCCQIIREGLIDSLDTSGLGSENRCRKICKLKTFLEDKISILDKIRRPGANQLSSELVQMIHCTLDSHLVTYLNCSFFNPRRKSTGTVEQFFSQITLMNDGGLKLNCVAVADILKRVTITNSLRLLPESIKGFSFLKHLNVHMKSYLECEDTNSGSDSICYPQVKSLQSSQLVILPKDSAFDMKTSKKRKIDRTARLTGGNLYDGAVRKYHRKFVPGS